MKYYKAREMAQNGMMDDAIGADGEELDEVERAKIEAQREAQQASKKFQQWVRVLNKNLRNNNNYDPKWLPQKYVSLQLCN